MTALRTLLVAGTDLRSWTGVNLLRADLFAPGTRRGSHDTIAGKQGQLGAEMVYDAYSFAVVLEVTGANEAQTITRFRTIGTAVKGTNGLVTLERRLPNSGGTFDASTAAGQFAGFSDIREISGNTSLTTTLNFVNLDGAWTPDSGTTWLVP